jgi:thiosulfate dehydrogenase [quinone] large subunit
MTHGRNRPWQTRVAHYNATALSASPKSAFANDYAYNKFVSGSFKIRAAMVAAATITLPPSGSDIAARAKFVRLTDVDGQTFCTRLDSEP